MKRFAFCLLLLYTGLHLSAEATSAQDADSTAAADSLLIQELAREMAGGEENVDQATRGNVGRAAATTNPDISVIGDARGAYRSVGERNIDVGLQEAEFAFRSAVDPYARADFYIAVGQHGEEEDHGDEGGRGLEGGEENGGHGQEEAGLAFELEEAYLTTLSLPFRLQARAGKFRTTMGKINLIHPHALPFIDTPAVYENYFGEEGLNDHGLELSWLVPIDRFYQELTVTAHRGPAESASFARSDDNRLLYVARLRNFWDLSADATFELGLNGFSGVNQEHEQTLMGGIDLTYIWKPVQFNTYRSLTLQTEMFWSERKEHDGETVSSFGMYALASWQLARRWFVTGRYDFSELPSDAEWDQNGLSATLGWYLTEFQKIELGGTAAWGDSIETEYRALARLVFVIGTHGAHQY